MQKKPPNTNQASQASQDKQREQIAKVWKETEDGLLSIFNQVIARKVSYASIERSTLAREDLGGKIASNVIMNMVEQNTIFIEPIDEKNVIEIPQNYCIVQLAPENHSRLVIESLIRGIPILKSMNQSDDKKTVVVHHYLIIKDMDTVMYDEIVAPVQDATDKEQPEEKEEEMD